MGLIGISRVSDQMRTNTLLGALRRTGLDLGRVQEQLATGNRLLAPSVDPPAADASFSLQRGIAALEQVMTNIQDASRLFAVADTRMGAAADMINEAVALAQANMGSGVDQTTRQSIASRIGELSRSMLDIANARVGDVYIFGGTASTTVPFVTEAAGVRYAGRRDGLEGLLGGTGATRIGVTGDEAFGAMSSQVAGYKDLRPAMTAATRLADLEGASGQGVRLGTILIHDNAADLRVDLAGCDTIGDVVSRINAQGGGAITASIGPGGDRLLIQSAAGGLTVTEVGAAQAAHDLGIYRPDDQGNFFLGDDLAPKVAVTTRLSDLAGGAGVDTVGGLRITNAGKTAVVDLSGAQTVGDLLNAINAADVGVQARVNAAGDGIDVVNTLSGAEMRIGENGGATAEDLGVRSLHAATQLSQLNGGVGVRMRTAGDGTPQADIRIAVADGASYDIDLNGAQTVQDVLDLINAATGGDVTASLAVVGNGIVLTDNTVGPGSLTVTPLNAADAAADLGLLVSPVGATLTGDDVNPVTPSGVFAHLAQLANALGREGVDINERTMEINRIVAQLTDDRDRLVALRSRMGGLVADLENRLERTEDQKIAHGDLLSRLKDTDFTEAVSRFQALQAALQGNLITASRMLGTSLLDFLR